MPLRTIGWPKGCHDAVGRLVPMSMEPVFRGRALMTEWAERIARILHEIHTLADKSFVGEVDFDKLDRLLNQAQIEILLSAPYEVCDCPPTERDCPECSGKHWRSRKTIDLANLEPGVL